MKTLRSRRIVAKIIPFFLTALWNSAGIAAEGTALSLQTAVERALAAYPSIQAAEAAREEARAGVGEARGALFPSLGLNASATRFEEPMVVTPIHGFRPGQFPEFDETLIQGSLHLNYLLFDGGGRRARIRQAESNTGAAAAELSAAETALIARVAAVYLEILSRREILQAHDRRLAALRSELTRARQRFEAGRAARLEILRVEAALASAEAERVGDAEALTRAERDLARLINRPSDEIHAAPLIPVALSDRSLPPVARLKSEALESSPALAEARSRVRSAEAAASLARSERWPELSLGSSINTFGSGGGIDTSEWQAGIQLSFSIFEGGAKASAVSRAEAALRRARAQLRLTELGIDQEIDQALSAVVEAHARVESLTTAVARFEEVVRVEQLLLETGAGTQTDFLNAESDLLTARASLVQSRHREIAARIELGRVIGRLDRAWLAAAVVERLPEKTP